MTVRYGTLGLIYGSHGGTYGELFGSPSGGGTSSSTEAVITAGITQSRISFGLSEVCTITPVIGLGRIDVIDELLLAGGGRLLLAEGSRVLLNTSTSEVLGDISFEVTPTSQITVGVA